MPEAPTLAGSPPPAVYLHPCEFAFTVGGDPSARVTTDDAALPPGMQLSGRGVLSGTPERRGNYDSTLTAGNGVLRDASLPTSLTVRGVPVTVSVSTSGTPSVFSQPVTLRAVVSPQSSRTLPVPGGPVQFFDGPTRLGTADLRPVTGSPDAVATIGPLDDLAVGPHRLTAAYGVDEAYEGGTSPGLDQQVTAAATLTTVTSSVNPSAYDEPVTLSATVRSQSPATAQPEGSVVFTVDGTASGPVPLRGGTAQLPARKLAPGAHPVSAEFVATEQFAGSTGELAGGQEAGRGSSATAVSASPNPARSSEAITATAAVTPVAPAPFSPSGDVEFYVDGDEVGSSTLNASHRATLVLPRLRAGGHQIAAVCRGDHDLMPSVVPQFFEVVHPG